MKNAPEKARFKFLEHTADLEIKIFGGSQKEIFKNAAFALANILDPLYPKREKKSQKSFSIKQEAPKMEVLLVYFLEELLYNSLTKKSVFPDVRIKTLRDKYVTALAYGYYLGKLPREIKGVSYHDLSLKKGVGNLWEAKIVLDI